MRLTKGFELNYWFAVADLVLVLSMIFLLMWAVERQKTRTLTAEAERLRQELETLKRDKPPIVTLDEASGFTFESGSTRLSTSFETALEGQIIPKLNQTLEDYDVNVVEVIGHTDGQTVTS